MNTAPFDLEKAIAGHPLTTRGGRRVLHFAAAEPHDVADGEYPLTAYLGDSGWETFSINGEFIENDRNPEDLLLLLPDDEPAAPAPDTGDRLDRIEQMLNEIRSHLITA